MKMSNFSTYALRAGGVALASAMVAGSMAAVLAACGTSNDPKPAGARAVSPAATTASAGPAGDPIMKAWHKTLASHRPPKEGCFHTSYPSADWIEEPCVDVKDAPTPSKHLLGARSPSPSSQRPPMAAAPAMPQTATTATPGAMLSTVEDTATTPFAMPRMQPDQVGGGNGYDWFAVLTGDGTITQATGWFPTVSSGISLSTQYSIQLNTNQFGMAYTNEYCNYNPAFHCQGAEQAIYMPGSGSPNGLYLEYILIDGNSGGSTCPSGNNWSSGKGGDGSCYKPSASVPNVPDVGIADLANMSLTFAPGPDDYLLMTLNGESYSEKFVSILGVNGWNSVQFGVYGDDDGDEAVFNSADTLIVSQVSTVITGGSIGCSTSIPGGSTTEYNNLDLVPNCCLDIPYDNGPAVRAIPAAREAASLAPMEFAGRPAT